MVRSPAFTLRCRALPISKGVPRSRQRLHPFSTTASLRGPLLNTLKHDHQELAAYAPHIVQNKNADERTRFRNLFVWELARHSMAEEIIIYPAIQKHVENGRDMANKDRDQHQSIKKQLYYLQNLGAKDPDFEPTFDALFSSLQRHVEEEEEHDLPALEAKLDEDSLLQLGRSFDRAKAFVPTRSHPQMPRAPPLETAAALLSAPIDKFLDIFRKFPKVDGPML
ncbi:HHE domain protein [Daldinia caldariorum]|uniref:HHE domain protein n=1 Tax=Daldinia caldariorum TaxID=326644 RepID=UPI0020082356|nr:HHE domain protein [Daldinia caldariorum]KAI1469481.1 HHE domain protein [Daldinia caldariorum]